MSHYNTLGVSDAATQDEIKRAYRNLAKEFHPDKNPDANTKVRFQQIQEAYSVLSDPNKKATYDRTQSGPSLEDLLKNFNFGSNFAGDFDNIFGNRGNKGPDVKVSAQLSIYDVIYGAQRVFDMGYDKININFPKGVKNGMIFKYPQRGQYHPMNSNAPRGDLIVTVTIIPSEQYIIQGNDIWFETNVRFYDMILGTTAEITAPTGKISFKIPPKSGPGKVLRIPGKGLPIYNTHESGSILVKLNTTFHGLNDAQIELIHKIKEVESGTV